MIFQKKKLIFRGDVIIEILEETTIIEDLIIDLEMEIIKIPDSKIKIEDLIGDKIGKIEIIGTIEKIEIIEIEIIEKIEITEIEIIEKIEITEIIEIIEIEEIIDHLIEIETMIEIDQIIIGIEIIEIIETTEIIEITDRTEIRIGVNTKKKDKIIKEIKEALKIPWLKLIKLIQDKMTLDSWQKYF